MGLSTLAVAVGEEPDTVETVAEPYLVREGYMVRTPRGRAASAQAWEHLGLTPPRDAQSLWASRLPLGDDSLGALRRVTPRRDRPGGERRLRPNRDRGARRVTALGV